MLTTWIRSRRRAPTRSSTCSSPDKERYHVERSECSRASFAQQPPDGGVASVAVIGGGYSLAPRTAMPSRSRFLRPKWPRSSLSPHSRSGAGRRSFRCVSSSISPRLAAAGSWTSCPAASRIPETVRGENGAAPRHAEPRKGVALGSGFFVAAEGYVVTNNHVVENALSVSIAMDDGRVLDAHVVGADAKTDLALLKVDGRVITRSSRWRRKHRGWATGCWRSGTRSASADR